MSRVRATEAAAYTNQVAQGAVMGQVVLTSRSCAFARPPAPAPVRLPTVAKWKVVKKKTKFRPRKVRSCAVAHLRLHATGVQAACACAAALTCGMWCKQVSESARKHVGCTTHPVLPPPPPQYTIIKVRAQLGCVVCQFAIVVRCSIKRVCFSCRRHDAWTGAPG